MGVLNALIGGGGGIDSSGTGWVRFTDGTQICWGTVSIRSSSTGSATFGNLFNAAPTAVLVGASRTSGSTSYAFPVSVKSTSERSILVHQGAGSNYSVSVYYVAIGKWK